MTHVDRAILDALDQGCTGKTRALAQAYRALRVAHHYTSREALEWTWKQMEREGIIIRDGRQYRARDGGSGMTTNDDRLAPLRRLFADLAWDDAAASVRLDYDQTQTAETTEDICRELRAAGLDPERMQRRVRELRDAARREVTR